MGIFNVLGKLGRGIAGTATGGLSNVAFDALSGGKRKKMRRFSAAELAGTREHIAHGHTRATPGHGWMTDALIAQAQQGTLAGSLTTNLRAGAPGCPEGTVGIPPACFNLPGGGGSTGFTGGGIIANRGEVVMGQYGAAMVPGSRIQDTAVCLPGMVVGKDGLCYNKRDLRPSERAWPPGRKPLLTGGEMSAISKAARAAGKLERTSKRLQKIGLMKKPTRRPARRDLGAGHTHVR